MEKNCTGRFMFLLKNEFKNYALSDSKYLFISIYLVYVQEVIPEISFPVIAIRLSREAVHYTFAKREELFDFSKEGLNDLFAKLGSLEIEGDEKIIRTYKHFKSCSKKMYRIAVCALGNEKIIELMNSDSNNSFFMNHLNEELCNIRKNLFGSNEVMDYRYV